MDFPPEKSYGRSLYPLLQYNESSFIPEPYVPPRIIQDAHQQPRFGRPNNLDGVFNGVQQQTREYVTGVIIGSLIIAIVAIVWLFAIVCLKIAGPQRVGFFSGRFVRPTANPEQKTSCEADIVVEGEKSWNDAVVMDEGNETLPTITMGGETQSPQTSMNFGRRVLVVRVLFVLSGIAVLISGMFCVLLRC